jgi:hypothetical protein
VPATVPWVRIPPLPPLYMHTYEASLTPAPYGLHERELGVATSRALHGRQGLYRALFTRTRFGRLRLASASG